MKARKVIVRLPPNRCRKAREGAGIAGRELCEGREIGRDGRVVLLLGPKRLISPERFRPAAKNQIADRSALKSLDLPGNTGADANPRAELLVGRLQPGGDVDRVAIGGVVEEPPAAEITHDRRTRMH